MKIGIDISQIVYGTGVSWYTKNLVDSLLKLGTGDEFVLYGGSLRQIHKIKYIAQNFSGTFKTKFFPIPPVMADILWNKLHLLSVEKLIGKVDVFHASDWSEPPCRAPKVTTIHDLSAIIYPNSVRHDGYRNVTVAHKNRLRWVKLEAEMIIAVSEATKKDIVKYLGIEEERIVVIYEAPDPIYHKKDPESISAVREKYNISGDYVLSVGTGPRKNNERVYEAVTKDRALGGLKHVVVGRTGASYGNGSIFVNGPTTEEIAGLYSGAKALVYASSYEGFGLPILEAFACECPVVTSNVSSMPEIAGDAAILVNPESTSDISRGIKTAIEDAESLVKKGSLRLRNFSWEKTAKDTLGVYKQIVK